MMARCTPPFHIFSILFVLLRITGCVSGNSEDRAVGGTVTFTPDAGSVTADTTSIIWKQTDKAGSVTKVVDWDPEDQTTVPNPRFENVTSLDITTGKLTLKNLKLEHSGQYIIEINSRAIKTFALTVMHSVSKPPEITKEASENNPDVYYLKCVGDINYVKSIIWKNAAGEILKDYLLPENPQHDKQNGGSYTVQKSSDSNNYYTCTFKNPVSEETSEPIYERDLFFSGLGGGAIAALIISIIAVIGIALVAVVYKFKAKICGYVQTNTESSPDNALQVQQQTNGTYVNVPDGNTGAQPGNSEEDNSKQTEENKTE